MKCQLCRDEQCESYFCDGLLKPVRCPECGGNPSETPKPITLRLGPVYTDTLPKADSNAMESHSGLSHWE